MQSWVSKSNVRSVSDEPESMQQAAENRRRMMGSSLFGGSTVYSPPPQMASTLRPQRTEPEKMDDYSESPQEYQNFSKTLPANSNFGNEMDDDFPPQIPAFKNVDFPNLDFDPTPPDISFSDFGFLKSTQNMSSTMKRGQSRRLQVPPNDQMRQLRDDLNRETEIFNQKLRQIGK